MFLSVLCMLLKAFVSCNIFRFLSLQGKRFLGARFFFFFFYARKSTMLKLQKRGGNRASQREQGRGWGERQENVVFFSPPHASFSSFALAPTLRVAISTLPNVPLSEYQRRQLQ